MLFQPPDAKSICYCKTIVTRNVRSFKKDDTMQEGAMPSSLCASFKAILTASSKA